MMLFLNLVNIFQGNTERGLMSEGLSPKSLAKAN